MYPIPGFPGYSSDEEGNIFKYGKQRKPTYKNNKGGRAKMNLVVDGVRYTKSLARLVLSAKLGRELQHFEDACHINGNPTDDRMVNLTASDRINNIIDELELGRLETTDDYLDLAIERLTALKKIK